MSSTSGARSRRLAPMHMTKSFWAGSALLVLLLGVLGHALIPRHYTSIWLDREFTGWVAPIADRFATGQRLYADGGHSPIPPLSFLLVYALTGGHARWITESTLYFLFQALEVLTLYVGLSYRLAEPIPFVAALGTIPVFLLTGKEILYDSLAQFLTALVATIGALYATRASPRNDGPPPRLATSDVSTVCVLGGLSAACGLAKQNTGAGAVLGITLLLLLFPRPASLLRRLTEVALYVAAGIGVACLICLIASPWISVSGLIVDVFLTGTEPKGGSGRMLLSLGNYAVQIKDILIRTFPLVLLLWLAGERYEGDAREGQAVSSIRRSRADGWRSHAAFAAACVGALSVLLAWYFQVRGERQYNLALDHLGDSVLSYGLGLCLVVALWIVGTQRRYGRAARQDWRAVAAFSVATLFPAVTHSLSGPFFRWTYDNNPLIMLTIAAVLVGIRSAVARLDGIKRARWVGTAVLIVAVLVGEVGLWRRMYWKLDQIRRCSVAWPEVSYLAGAGLGRSAQGMRDLVAAVRRVAPNRSDTVLLLPEDPNVEMWFDRPRPRLTSAIVFTDQYWERYVDEDFKRLEAHPPTVIVIGPRDGWRPFSLGWNLGAVRLIDRVQKELLPRFYSHHLQQQISLPARMDIMDVYFR
jgi:hypothetical protein